MLHISHNKHSPQGRDLKLGNFGYFFYAGLNDLLAHSFHMLPVRDFTWSPRGVRVKETGAFIPFSWALAWDVWRGGSYILFEWLRPRHSPPHIPMTFHPRPPRAWYLLWGALRQGGVVAGKHGMPAYFYDETYAAPEHSLPKGLNSGCTDISKSRVADIFEQVFGYSLSIDPQTHEGPYVAKSEINGRHDGQICDTPQTPRPGYVYQRLIDTKTKDGLVTDIRCPTVYGQIPLIFVKQRPAARRFENLNTQCRLADPDELLSADERRQISRFCQKIGLDWGGLDILRDNRNDRIYIVDVNKTDMGPPLALPLRHKLRATKVLGRALRAALLERS